MRSFISGTLLRYANSRSSDYHTDTTVKVQDVYTNVSYNIYANGVYYMYIEQDGNYLLKHRDIGTIRVSEDAYMRVNKYMDSRFVKVYDIDNDRFVIFNNAGVRDMYKNHKGDYIIRLGKYGKFRTHYDYYYLVGGLLGIRERSFKEKWLGMYDRPKYSLDAIREVVRLSKEKTASIHKKEFTTSTEPALKRS